MTISRKAQILGLAAISFLGGCASRHTAHKKPKANKEALVIMTDFGVKDAAVATMKGVAFGVDHKIAVFDLTHEIPTYNIWEAAYRLKQTVQYWPRGTVFVSVVDPGVGSDRHSIVALSKSGHYFVTPDNGTLTLIQDEIGISEVRRIDETRNRLAGSEGSYTFHGRDVYAYTGARLASAVIGFEDVGPLLQATDPPLVHLDSQAPAFDGKILKGNIPVLDPQYGNVWTNIPQSLYFSAFGQKPNTSVRVKIFHAKKQIFSGLMPFETTFSGVKEGLPLLYINSLLNVSFALNMANFSTKYKVLSGADWTVELSQP